MSEPQSWAPDSTFHSKVERPSTLLRFCDRDGIKTLVDGTLKVTPPDEFNDPFEFSPGIDPNLEKNPPCSDELRGLFLGQDSVLRAAYFEKLGSGTEEGYRSWVESTALKHPELMPGILHGARKSLLKQISQGHGVACFAAFSDADLIGPDVVRHWAHYADEHRGMAIEFDIDHEFFRRWETPKWLFPVSYETPRPIFRYSDLTDFSAEGLLDKLRRWGSVKSEAWMGESEWRLIVPLAVPMQHLPVHRVVDGERILHLLPLWRADAPNEEKTRAAGVIRRIILGSRASGQLEQSVTRALHQPHLGHVVLQRARTSLSHFGMELALVKRPLAV